jgi:hypothetical protein
MLIFVLVLLLLLLLVSVSFAIVTRRSVFGVFFFPLQPFNASTFHRSLSAPRSLSRRSLSGGESTLNLIFPHAHTRARAPIPAPARLCQFRDCCSAFDVFCFLLPRFNSSTLQPFNGPLRARETSVMV